MRRLLLDLARPYRGTLSVILLAMLLEAAMSLASPWPLKVILDNVIGPHKAPPVIAYLLGSVEGHSTRMHLAALAGLAFVLIALIKALASYIENYFTGSVGQWIAHDLRMRTYHHLQRLSLSYYDTHHTGALLSTITDDVQTIQGFVSSSTLGIGVDLITIVCMVILMFWLNWDFTLIALGITPLLLLFVARFKKAVKSATHEVRLKQSSIVSVVQEGLESIRVVQAFGRQDLEQAQLDAVSRATVQAALKARRIKSSLSPIVTLTVSCCTALVLWRGADLVLENAMTVGALIVFLSYLSSFFKPVQDLAKMSNTIAQAAVGVERIRAILETDMITPERPGAIAAPPMNGGISFEQVSFKYGAEAPILRDVSFVIQPGQFIGIIGPTGGGKSTIMSLIPRFYDPTSGKILMDGADLLDFQIQSVRDQIGYVLQDTVLFRGTVFDNIAFGRSGATREEVIEAATLANADEFIQKMPLGYETMLGEGGGHALSGGQRQRIGIARVMVRNTPILLLDEPTAALDSESEKAVMEALERLMKGRTVVMVAHRLSTVRNADNIIVIKNGSVAEQGTHRELLSLDRIYADLYRTQFAEEASAKV